MNRLIIILVLVSFFSCSKENKNTIDYEKLGATYVRHQYKDKKTTTQLAASIRPFIQHSDSLIHPKYDVTAYRIFYTTHDFQNNEILASGIIYVPEITNYFSPVICYQHGTAFQKQEVPSIAANLDYYVPFIMASETGAIVCAADYIGLGFSGGVQHFYEPNEEANAVVDMLGSVQILLNKTYHKLTFNYDVFLMGYSQGGHATLAAQRKLETHYPTQFHLQASAPMASWFALENSTQLVVLEDSIDYDFSSAYAFLINSLQSTQQLFPNFTTVFISPYDSLVNTLFDGTHSIGEVNAQFPNYFYSTLQPAFKIDLKNNPNNILLQAVKKYDIINDWIPKTPTRFYHSEDDEIAFYNNSEIAYNTFKQKGGNVELVSLGSVSHFDGNIIAIEKVRDWFYPLIHIQSY